MSTVVVKPGDMVRKNSADIRVYQFDWATDNLATGVSIATNDFDVAAVHPASATLPTLTESGTGLGIQSGNRTTKVKVTGGTSGAIYELSNTIITDETPAQTKKYSFFLTIT